MFPLSIILEEHSATLTASEYFFGKVSVDVPSAILPFF